MSAELPPLAVQASRWHELNNSGEARAIADMARWLAGHARRCGLRVEIVQVSHAQAMGATHEEITVTPSREGYQSAA